MGTRLFEELELLRDLNERQELQAAKRALEESGRQKDLLIKVVHHRVKNSLQIVSSLLLLQAKTAGAAAGQFHAAAARVAAIATVHEQLHKLDDIGMVALDCFLADLCQAIATASSSSDRPWSLMVEADPLVIPSDIAMPLGLIVNELITNAIKHSQSVAGGGRVQIVLKSGPDDFSISVCNPGEGPAINRTSGPDTLLPGWARVSSSRSLARSMPRSQRVAFLRAMPSR
jgi:two-component sensor histidine kinase